MEQDRVEAFAARVEEAEAFFDADRLGDAIAAYEALIPDLKRVLGNGHPETLSAQRRLVDWLIVDFREEEAEALVDAVIDDLPDSLFARRFTARFQYQIGRDEEAEATLQAAVSDHIAALGTDHVDTREARHELAFVQYPAHSEKAIATLEALIADEQRILGVENRDSLVARAALGCFLGYEGRTREAMNTLKAALDDQRRFLDSEDPVIVDTAEALAELHRAVRAFGETEARWELELTPDLFARWRAPWLWFDDPEWTSERS